MAYDSRVIFRVDSGTRARWEAAAEADGRKLSDWMRRVMDREVMLSETVRAVPPVPQDLGRGSVRPVVPAESGSVSEWRAREFARGVGVAKDGCSADVARGTRCKLCGKIH